MAAFLIDHKMYGRKRMQQIGFFMDFLIYVRRYLPLHSSSSLTLSTAYSYLVLSSLTVYSSLELQSRPSSSCTVSFEIGRAHV